MAQQSGCCHPTMAIRSNEHNPASQESASSPTEAEGPQESVDDVELATLLRVNWLTTVRLGGTLNDIPPTKFEARNDTVPAA